MNSVKTGAQEFTRTESSISATTWLWIILALGLLIRIAFMGQSGFANDVSSFEAWALNLTQHATWQFYQTTSFADYPPGYFYILWIVGHVFALFGPHADVNLLKYLVKLPAVLVDLADGALLFAIVRRFANERWALIAAAAFVFNPAIIFISASWGQVDSISSGLALLGVFLLLRSDDYDDRGASYNIVGAWLALAYSLLIKPQASVLIPLFIAFAFTSAVRRNMRLTATGFGIAGAIVLVFLLTLPFHPALDALGWLYDRYNYGKNVYAYNTVNAFNLWSILHPFWQRDSDKIGFFPQYVWGVLLLAAAVVLTVVRYVQWRSKGSLIEAAAIVSLAFFMLSTRMHERYIYEGLLFTIAAMPFGKRYPWAALLFTVTLFVNLFYSLTYLDVVMHNVPGVNAQDMWPPFTHILSFLNVAMFFVLGFVYLGQTDEAADAQTAPEVTMAASRSTTQTTEELPLWLKVRSWFDPREGLGSMVWPLDHLLAGGLGIVSFILSYVNYWKPADKIFDEIYFARAGEEYLKGLYIYENTHPPLTKLIITLSIMLFGGLEHGDNSYGWRFFDVLFGAIAVGLLYVFAKRLTRSTLFASFASLIFIADGMHFVQSRIATPEGIVIVFSTGAIYAFYRFWIASQSVVRPNEPPVQIALFPRDVPRWLVALVAAIVPGLICAAITMAFGNPAQAADVVTPPAWTGTDAWIISWFYYTCGWYLIMRVWIVPRLFPPNGVRATYADGSVLTQGTGEDTFVAPNGAIVKKNFDIVEEEARASYRREGTLEYSTPAGSAVYSPGKVTDDQGEIEEGRHATGWLIAFTVLLGALVASKWYGVMAYGVSFAVALLVWLQRYWAAGRIKRWGNPYGFRLDITLVTVIFLSMSVYICSWIPDLTRHVHRPGDTGVATVNELVYRQYSMYEYHHNLKATHPYASTAGTWPLDLRPIAYYWKDTRSGASMNAEKACCVAEIMSLPNPLTMWFGLLCVPLVGFLAWRENNKGYALLVIAYLFQWLPWFFSPRLAWIYHFYANVPLIILCNIIVLQRIWNYFATPEQTEARILARTGVLFYVGVVVLAFIWFYPILSGQPLPWNEWHARLWLGDRWV